MFACIHMCVVYYTTFANCGIQINNTETVFKPNLV